jgi:hypothetical protein
MIIKYHIKEVNCIITCNILENYETFTEETIIKRIIKFQY